MEPCNVVSRHNFYPRSPCGERQEIADHIGDLRDFYPRSPCGERLTNVSDMAHALAFLSTLSLRRATSAAY